MNKIIKNLFYLFLPLISGTIIGFIIRPFMDYSTLVKPPLAPPSILFPIMWTIIYLLLGISFYLYKKNSSNNPKINTTYYISLIINLSWSIFFFIFKWYFFTIIVTIILLISLIYLLYLFYNHYKISFYLNILYLLWLIFATYLTIGIFILN